MWPSVKKRFERQVVRADIVKKMIQSGIRVAEGDKLYVGDIEIDYTAVAKAVGVDRRVVKQTVHQIRADSYLDGIFSNIVPFGSSLLNVVSKLGYSAIVIESDPRMPGVMAAVAAVLARHDMVIRQALAEDPDMLPDAKMILIVEGSAANMVQELNQLPMVRSIKILK